MLVETFAVVGFVFCAFLLGYSIAFLIEKVRQINKLERTFRIHEDYVEKVFDMHSKRLVNVELKCVKCKK